MICTACHPSPRVRPTPTRRTLLLTAASLLGTTPALAKLPLAAVPISRLDTPWWRERHAAKLAEIRQGRVDLVFLGDSITQDYEKSGPPAWNDFRPVWQRFYGDRNGEIDGISPKVAIVLIGANNLGRLHWPADDNVLGIDTVVAETRRRLPQTKILLLGVLPSERSDWATRTTLEVNRTLATRYGRGGVLGVTFLDVGAVFMRGGALDRSLFLDPLLQPPEPPLHPTAEGQARMAAAIEPTLAALLGDRNHTVA